MEKFKSIRPYQDSEIRPVVDQLIRDPEFLESIANFYFPKLTRLFPGLIKMAASHKLKRQVRGVTDVNSMQDVIATYMDKIIIDTNTEPKAMPIGKFVFDTTVTSIHRL